MVNALGFSNAPFNPFRAGRLCRGRERWIEPWEPDEDETPTVHRLVISGAAFSDLSAADALRGIPHSKVDTASMIAALFPRKKMLAFMEDGHPADIPETAEGVELYEGYRAGGRSNSAQVRWWQHTSGVKEIRALLKQDLRGFAVLDGATDPTELFDELFLLVGMATLDSPPAHFQPAALPALVQKVRALVLIHRDKHGLAVGIYSKDPIDVGTKLQTLCKKADALLVPFAIPPMLARWDRALSELRDSWTEETPFPVPEPEGGYNWEARSRRRRGRKERKKPTEAPSEAVETEPEAAKTEPEATETSAPATASATPSETTIDPLDELLLVEED